MKGLYFRRTGSLDNLTVEELPMPTPQAGEVLVNPGDVKNVLGKMSLI
jgi:NADPH:quinone reductase-like Zn-dependent oxidoreductase